MKKKKITQVFERAGICIKYNIKDYENLMHICYPIK